VSLGGVSWIFYLKQISFGKILCPQILPSSSPMPSAVPTPAARSRPAWTHPNLFRHFLHFHNFHLSRPCQCLIGLRLTSICTVSIRRLFVFAPDKESAFHTAKDTVPGFAGGQNFEVASDLQRTETSLVSS